MADSPDTSVQNLSPDPLFEQWRDSLPATHWVKNNLSACRMGWDAHAALAPPPGWKEAVEAIIEQMAAIEDEKVDRLHRLAGETTSDFAADDLCMEADEHRTQAAYIRGFKADIRALTPPTPASTQVEVPVAEQSSMLSPGGRAAVRIAEHLAERGTSCDH